MTKYTRARVNVAEDERFMKMALSAARRGIARGQTPFGACIVRGGKVVVCEHNSVWARTDITAHAEIVALRRACHRLGTVKLHGCTIYSTTEPCPMCFSACHWAGIERIVYGASIQDALNAGFNELNISCEKMRKIGGSQIEIRGGVIGDEARSLFAQWQRTKGHRAY